MCRLCDAYSLLPNRWMMVNPRATRDTVVQGFERPRAPPRPHAGPAPRSYLTMHCARRVGRVGCRLTGFSHNIPYFNAIRNKRIITVNPRSPYPSTFPDLFTPCGCCSPSSGDYLVENGPRGADVAVACDSNPRRDSQSHRVASVSVLQIQIQAPFHTTDSANTTDSASIHTIIRTIIVERTSHHRRGCRRRRDITGRRLHTQLASEPGRLGPLVA